jgi:hypothetical protein
MPLSLTPSTSQHQLIKDGWFSEVEAMWPGQKFCIEVDEVLANGRSDFQVTMPSSMEPLHQCSTLLSLLIRTS